MAATTNFDDWLDVNGPEDSEDKEDLIASVEGAKDCGNYKTTRKGAQLFVTGWGDDTLRLATDLAAVAFVHYVREAKMPDDIDIDFMRAVTNPNS